VDFDSAQPHMPLLVLLPFVYFAKFVSDFSCKSCPVQHVCTMQTGRRCSLVVAAGEVDDIWSWLFAPEIRLFVVDVWNLV
jgi:hypothetical protein